MRRYCIFVLCLVSLAASAWAQNDTLPTLDSLEAMIEANPNDYVAHFNLGRAYFTREEVAKAKQQFEIASGLRPDYVPARMALIKLSLRRGDVDAAYKMATETQRLDPTNKTTRLLIAAANLRKGNFSECRAQLDQLLQDSPRSVDVLLERGVLDLMQKRYPEAEQAYRSAFDIDRSNPRGILGVAETYFQRGDPDRAVLALANAVRDDPQRAELGKALSNAEVRARMMKR